MSKNDRLMFEAECKKRWGTDIEGKLKESIALILEVDRSTSIGSFTRSILSESLGRNIEDVFDEVDYYWVAVKKPNAHFIALALTQMAEDGNEVSVGEILEKAMKCN